MLTHIASWVAACVSFEFSDDVRSSSGRYKPKYRKLYRRYETALAVAEWHRMTAEDDPRMDEDALNLIALGYLRARLSNGSDRPRGFHGIFQLDVLNRRGMMATGVGVRNGTRKLEEFYVLGR